MHCIVVGTDGSPTAEEAIRQTAALAKAAGAHVHVVSGYDPISSDRHAPDGRAQANLQRASGLLSVEGVESTVHARRGDPVDAIIGVATEENADLIVVGNKGMNGRRRFLGSVPNKISHNAPCSVMIARTS